MMHHVMTAACCCLLVLGTGCQSPNGTSGSQSARLSQIEASEQAFRKMLEKEADLDWASEEVQDVVIGCFVSMLSLPTVIGETVWLPFF